MPSSLPGVCRVGQWGDFGSTHPCSVHRKKRRAGNEVVIVDQCSEERICSSFPAWWMKILSTGGPFDALCDKTGRDSDQGRCSRLYRGWEYVTAPKKIVNGVDDEKLDRPIFAGFAPVE